ncbi:fibroblast growth factor receptor 1-like [Dendronephthya gigantea]|uniref:fibroblast growth factor receptor 1-like n=1 Tax=Dendronephthya gigantea TaxID=151771 RepID=UPI00106BC972|nr:fibroblast growth factor receptor 1-like [Dendronephthya gigantea]XP_028412702.1 fibroblast growth factor receptor 1-like [Dendronephthya gigantea]
MVKLRIIIVTVLIAVETKVLVSLQSSKIISSVLSTSSSTSHAKGQTLITYNPTETTLRRSTVTEYPHVRNIKSSAGTSGNSSKRTQILIMYISVSVAAFSLLSVLFIVLWFCRTERKRKKTPSTTSSTTTNGEVPLLPAAPLLRKDIWKISRDRLKLGKKLGEGAFGFVFKATITNDENSCETKMVAVKMVKENASSSDKDDLLAELEIMKQLKPHPNVVSLIGAVLYEVDCPLVIVEFVPYGDLLGYLRKLRGVQDSCYFDPDHLPAAELSTQELMKFAMESALGMEYLSKKKIVHRDLAARNVLVGSGRTCKITDFGMARDIRRNEIYMRTTRGLIPIKWTAIESVLRGIYTTKSDVWSFGVLLFEIFTVGGYPYPGMDGYQVRDFISQGRRIPKPMHVDNELYQVMLDCWQSNPRKRPTFEQLVCTLKRLEPCHEEYLNLSEYNCCDYENLLNRRADIIH